MKQDPSRDLDTRAVRLLLDEVHKTIQDLDAFVLDRFPAVFRQFPPAMPRTERTTLLLSAVGGKAVLRALHTSNDDALQAACAKLHLKLDAEQPSLFGVAACLSLLLVGALAALVLGGPVLVSSTHALFAYISVLLISALATLVAYRLGGAQGVFRTPSSRLSGSAAVMATFAGLGLWGINRVPRPAETWTARGTITGLPFDKVVDVQLSDCLLQRLDPQGGHLSIQVHSACDRDPMPLVIRVAGHELQTESISRAEARVGFVRAFHPRLAATELWGTVTAQPSQSVVGLKVVLAGCPDANDLKPMTMAADGRFWLAPLPSSCRKPPYQVAVVQGDKPIYEWTGEHSFDIRIRLPLEKKESSTQKKIEDFLQCAARARQRARAATLDIVCSYLRDEIRCLLQASHLAPQRQDLLNQITVNQSYQLNHHCGIN